MSKYTTGELAKLCGVTVRTVQFYDGKGLLIPSELSEGGRRLYSEADFKKLQFICLLKSLGLGLEAIRGVLESENSEFILSTLLDDQVKQLQSELDERKEQLDRINLMKNDIKELGYLSVKKSEDIEKLMFERKIRKRFLTACVISGSVIDICLIAGLIFGFTAWSWLPLAVAVLLYIINAAALFSYYYRRVRFVCPKCHETFQPKRMECFFANHTPKTRKLTCTACGTKDWCIERFGEDLKNEVQS